MNHLREREMHAMAYPFLCSLASHGIYFGLFYIVEKVEGLAAAGTSSVKVVSSPEEKQSLVSTPKGASLACSVDLVNDSQLVGFALYCRKIDPCLLLHH